MKCLRRENASGNCPWDGITGGQKLIRLVVEVRDKVSQAAFG
jgi:hypothetical protein